MTPSESRMCGITAVVERVFLTKCFALENCDFQKVKSWERKIETKFGDS